MSLLPIEKFEKVTSSQTDFPFTYQLNRVVNEYNHLNLAWHEEMEIKYILSGSMAINLGTKTIRVKKGDIVIINPFEYHANVLQKGEEVEYHMLCINLSHIFKSNLFESTFLLDKQFNMRFSNLIQGDAQAKKYVDDLFSSFSQEDPLLSLGLFLAFFSTLKNHVDLKADIKQVSRDFAILNTAFPFIHAHFEEKLKIQEIAEKCYVSESHFCRVFKKLTNETPVSYINNLKLRKACSLMKNSNMSIKQISAAVGFDDASYFCRFFKKRIGCSPRDYLKQQYANNGGFINE